MTEGNDLTVWQQIGALVGTAFTGLGLGRVSKRGRDATAHIVTAIQQMEHTLDRRLSDLHTDIKLLLDRGDR